MSRLLRALYSSFAIVSIAACGHAQSPADNIELGPAKTCAGGGVWDGIECAAPHSEKESAETDTTPSEVAGKTVSKVAPCEDDDCDDSLDHTASTDGDFMTQGIAAYNARDYPKARKLFYELISKHPNSPHVGDAYFWFGKMFQEEGKTDPSKLQLAVQSYMEAGKFPKATQGPAALLELGNVYLQLGDTAKANLTFAQLRKRFAGSAAATKIPPGH